MDLRIVVFCVSVAAFSEAIANDKVAEQTESSSLEVAATLEPLRATTLLNRLEGSSVIQSIVPEGTTVKAGDVVCTMDVARHRDRVAKTQQLAMQEQQLKKAMEQQQLGQIIAPHDGVVVYANQNSRRPNSIALQAGQEIRERQALAHLHDRSRMRALIELNADHAKQLEPGQRVDVQVDALPNHSFDGTLTAFLNEKDSAEGLSKAWILIDPAKGVPLLDGMTAVVTIELDQ